MENLAGIEKKDVSINRESVEELIKRIVLRGKYAKAVQAVGSVIPRPELSA